MKEPEDRLGMTVEQWERFQALTQSFGDQDENGIDLSLLAENLRLTPKQRLERLQRAYDFFWEMRHAGTTHQLSSRH